MADARSLGSSRAVAARVARDPALETLRGLACILLVAFHVRGENSSDGLRLDGGDPWSYVTDSLVYIRMPLFTFLSGYIYAKRPLSGPVLPFVQGKARRLLIPLLVVGTIFAVVRLLAAPLTNKSTSEPWYLWHILPVAHFWFLESVFWVFVVVALLEKTTVLRRRGWAMVVLGAAVLADTVVPGALNVLGWRTAVFLLPFFLSGLLAQRFRWLEASRSSKVFVVVAALAGTAITQLGLSGVIAEVPSQRSVLACLLGVAGCLSLLLLGWRNRLLVTVGAFSFTVYTCHVFATSATRIVLHGLGLDSVSLNMILGTTAGVVFGVGVETLARRRPWTALLLLGARVPSRSGSGVVERPSRS